MGQKELKQLCLTLRTWLGQEIKKTKEDGTVNTQLLDLLSESIVMANMQVNVYEDGKCECINHSEEDINALKVFLHSENKEELLNSLYKCKDGCKAITCYLESMLQKATDKSKQANFIETVIQNILEVNKTLDD